LRPRLATGLPLHRGPDSCWGHLSARTQPALNRPSVYRTGGLTIAWVHLRRALLLFALVLGLTALATAIAPAPERSGESQVAPPPPSNPVPPATTVSLSAPPVSARTYKVDRSARVIVQVAAREGGQVEIPKLGQVQSASENAAARFDLLQLAPGRYDVLFEPSLGTPVKIGTLLSR
jgi:hypothetical protein